MNSERPGPTGKYPRGKSSQHDEGELAVAVHAGIGLNGHPNVTLEFGKPVSWLSLEPDMVDGLCETLQKVKMQAIELKKKRARMS